jgi:polyhydroxyalkanoate synthesis repressor PhaR
MSDDATIPQLIEVKKYPNRRLYDSTRSRHLTHEELYDLVVAGHTVRVTESKSGADITALVLMQASIERTPEKFAAIPPEIVHLIIRANDQMLRSFTSSWFAQLVQPLAQPLAQAGWPPAGGFTPWNPFAAASPARTAQPASEPPADTDVADLESRLQAMAAEIERLKRDRSA